MKQMILVASFLITAPVLFGQQKTGTKKLEDDIRPYWFVMLTKGSNRAQDSATASKIQQGHLANINRLYEEGKIKVAGPFGEGDWLGIFIFDQAAEGCQTKEEVEKLLKTDPAIASGRLNYDIRSWWTAPTGSFKPGKPTIEKR